jgi:hypothetical protein
MNQIRTYAVTLTEEQLKVVKKACELLCRLHLGQLNEVADLFIGRLPVTNADEPTENYRQLKEALTALSPIVTGLDNPHASLGVGNESAHPDHAIAYEIWRVVENYLQPHKFMREPLKLTLEPLPNIEPSAHDPTTNTDATPTH